MAIGAHTLFSPYGAQIPANTTTERLGNVWSISLIRRVLPEPASPVTATTALRPLATIVITDESSSRWLARPTNGTSVRTPIDGTRRSRPVTRHTRSDCSRPMTSMSSTNIRRISSEASSAVESPMYTAPGGAIACKRAATLTTSPIAVYSAVPATVPTTTSPVLTPTRRCSGPWMSA